jgi:CRISPR-associated Csx2 family protein
MTTLISFLGKGKERGGKYKTATYRFDDQPRIVPFFGMALFDYLKPQRLILVGTAGSMWDVFFENEANQNDDHLLELIEAVGNNAVDEEMLEAHATLLSQRLGCPVKCLLIGYARDESGQAVLLGQLAGQLNEHEHIALDITHSFRHLPMLALVAARFLARVKHIEVDDIYYGALEMTDQETQATPVIRLKGLLDLLDWVDALASYDKDGDYAAFAGLYERAGGEGATAGLLKQAAFFERTNQIGNARKPLKQFRQDNARPVSPMLELFQPELDKRTAWAEQGLYTERQERLAKQYLESGDYLRAATFGFESVVSRLVKKERNGDPMNFSHRNEVKQRLDEEVRDARKNRTESQTAYLNLRELRNALAHGSRSDFAEIQGAIASEESLRPFLTNCLKLVFNL